MAARITTSPKIEEKGPSVAGSPKTRVSECKSVGQEHRRQEEALETLEDKIQKKKKSKHQKSTN